MMGIGMAVRPPRQSLTHQAFAAIRRAGGTVLAAGAATPVLGSELRQNFAVGVTGTAAAATYNTATGVGSVTRVDLSNQSFVQITGLTASATYLMSVTNTGAANISVRQAWSSGTILVHLTPGTTTPIWFTGDATCLITAITGTNTFVINSFAQLQGYTYGNPPVRNFFDSAGTDILDSVTQVDQPVGLTLDAAGAVGPNISPALSNAAWQKTNAAWATVAGKAVATACPDGQSYYASGLIGQNKSYQYTLTIDSISSGSVYVLAGGAGGSVTHSNAGTFTGYIKTGAGNTNLNIITGGVTTVTISAFIVTELTGNHATQATTGSNPTLRRGLVNQLLYSQWGGGGNAPTGWTAFGGGGVEGALLPSGMRQRVFTSTASRDFIYSSANLAANSVYTVAVYVDANPNNAIASNILFQGSLPVGAGMTVADTVPAAGSFIVGTITTGGNAGAVTLRIGLGTSNTVTGSVTLSAPALFTGTVTAQQILAAGGIPLTTTAPASSALGNYWWQFDPAAPGDFLQCPVSSVGSGETLIVGCTPTGGAGTVRAAMVRRDDTAKTGMMIYADAANAWQLVGGNTVGFVATPFGGPATLNVPVVLSAVCSGNTATPYLNGVAGSPATSLAPVASVSTPLYLGALGGTFPFWGGESIAVRCPVAMPDADRRLVERWVGSLQGQTL